MKQGFWALWLALLVLVPGSREALAEPMLEPEAGSTIELTLIGRLGKDPVFAERVTSWFAPGRFRVRVRTSQWLDPRRVLAPDRDAVVYVWVTLDSDNLARLYFAQASPSGAPSYLVRDVRLEGGLDEMGAERIAQVLHLSTEALVEGEAESARDEVEKTLSLEPAVDPVASSPPRASAPPRPAPRKRAPSPSVVRVRGAGGYGVSFRADEGVWHGPRAGLQVIFGDQFGVRVALQGAVPQKRDLEPITLDIYGVSALLAATFRHRVGSSLSLEGFAGPGLDVVRYEPVRASEPNASLGAAEVEARPLAAFGGRLGFGESTAIVLVVQGALALSETHYDVVRENGAEVVGRAAAFVPTIGLELEF